MSGASALAAAKRRRGISSTPPPPPSSRTGVNGVGNARGSQSREPSTSVPTPMQLLENHHKRIAILETDVNKTKEDIKLVNNKETTVVPNNENLVKQIMQLEAKIAVLEEKLCGTKDEANDNNTDYYKEKMKSLELQMAELKQHVLKIQTFAMETNLAFMKERQQQQQKENEESEEGEESEENDENEEQENSNEEEEEES